MADMAEVSAITVPIATSDRRWWGPRIWRLLHSLAEISDRHDCGPLWRIVVHATAEVLPCAVCRKHFQDAIRRMHFPANQSMQARMRHSLWAAHAAVGGTLPEEGLAAEYGGERVAVAQRAAGLLREVSDAFRAFTNVTKWYTATSQLISLLSVAEKPPVDRYGF